ncbi:hypothetical protein KUF71_016263 [Frankliniella fusca]|uniref:Uncharacterized protein n=1 Tax=Frankliniella fusca TaxID=407009 RepID=A0AAE1LQ58_9NEOP|nr:hypothetical protein KUF71_016263 [Frankliniella fusca]
MWQISRRVGPPHPVSGIEAREKSSSAAFHPQDPDQARHFFAPHGLGLKGDYEHHLAVSSLALLMTMPHKCDKDRGETTDSRDAIRHAELMSVQNVVTLAMLWDHILY